MAIGKTKRTQTHQLKQKLQLAILEKKVFPCICKRSITRHLYNNVSTKAATHANNMQKQIKLIIRLYSLSLVTWFFVNDFTL